MRASFSRGRAICSFLRRSLPLVLDKDDIRQVAWPAIADAEHHADEGDLRAFRRALLGLVAALVQAFVWRRARRLASGRWAGIAAISIAAFTGVSILWRSERPGLALPQLMFLGLGLVLAVGLATSERASMSAMARFVGPLSSALLPVTAWMGAAQAGAARWIMVGPLTVQVSLLLWPWIVLAVADAIERRPVFASIVAATAVLGLVLQHDSTTAIVYGVAFVTVALRARRHAIAASWSAAAAVVIAASWPAPVELPVVEEVENAWRLSTALGPGFVALAACATALAAVSPWLCSREEGSGLTPFAAGAVAALVLFVARPILFAEPVFFLGYSGSAIIGALMAAALAASGSVRASSPPRPRLAGR